MTVLFRKSFERDLKQLKGNRPIRTRLRRVIEQLETAETIETLANVRRMQGWTDYYRIRIGDYRLGVKVEGDTVEVLRFLHRRDIYRRFP
ncbi:MAG: type II toxin-antitoxin system RelE/ParE family toxin [Bacteroidetes bacterium]|nr:MAG: type II toxin-antitoxin system RelE/ParE family toxin [Bacteroidota bacterium]